MTQEQIHQLFKQGYSQPSWKRFLAETFSKAQLLANPETLTGIDINIASKVLKLGYILLDEDGIERHIAAYEVTLAKGIILERNRVGLRNLLRKYWKDIDAAFIVYYNPENNKWRFTYVSELTGYDADGEFIKIKTEPKRYTYVLGEGESTRTAAERFSIITKKANKATLEDVKEAFSVEKLSKAFFDEYKEHYDHFCEFMVKKPNIRQTIFNGDEKAIRDFNKKLLGRIVFLYFIQKKGWMGVPVNSKWGQGDFNFLISLFNQQKNPDLFYSDTLSKLFFDTLNTKRKNDLTELVKGQPCRIPYLNGGLFEEDDKKHRNIILSPKLFENLFNFFNQYNFTIYEDDPNDHTVAVDPEMLGHIFENLLEDNKDKGAFYTPKEIVHYMCQESLIEYLTTWFQSKGYEVIGFIGFDKPQEPRLFSVNEGRKGQMLLETPQKTSSKQIDRSLIEKLLTKKLNDSDKKLVKQHAKEFHTALDNVKILDPAIGSGAFPMGLLQEIFTSKQTLYHFEHGNLIGFPASEVKLNIIQNSIYGVDIEKGAVDIARLRFWLSLVVDEEEPKALPNLDYKIIVGNSLISKLGEDIVDIDWNLNETSHGLFGADFAQRKIDLLKQINQEQKDFFNPESDKKRLATDIRKLKIDLLINQLELMVTTKGIETKPSGTGKKLTEQTEIYLQTLGWKDSIKQLRKLKDHPNKSLHFFDWKLDFPEIMNEHVSAAVGFDIVIANPPYISIRTKSFDKTYKSYFKDKYVLAVGQYDLYVLFIEKTFHLLKPKGILSYIIPKRMLSNESFEEARKFVLKKLPIFKYVDAEMPFESANVEANIMLGKKTDVPTMINSFVFDINDRQFKHRTSVNAESISKMPFNIFPFIFDDKTLKVLFKIQLQKNKTLSNFMDITRGFECGYNDEAIGKGKLKLLKAEAIKAYVLDESEVYTCKPDFSNASKYKSRELFEGVPKLMSKFVASKIEFALDTVGYYNTNSVYNAHLKTSSVIDIYYLLGILNSKLITFWFNTAFLNTDTLFPHIQKNQLDAIPIAFNEESHSMISQTANEILKRKSAEKSTIDLERKIDNVVYKLYELEFNEVKTIDPEFELSKQEYDAIQLGVKK